MPFGIGIWEIAVLLLIALLIFGPKRLPEMGRSLGKGMREFKDSISGITKDEDEQRFELPGQPSTQTTVTPAATPTHAPVTTQTPSAAPSREHDSV